MKCSDRRAVQDVSNLFFKTKKIQLNCCLDKIQIALRKGRSGEAGKLNAGRLRDKAHMSNILFKDIAYKFLNSIRGSPAYFQAVSKDLFAMLRQLGIASIFCSFSAAETRWSHLLKILGKVVDQKDYTIDEVQNFSWQERTRLIRSDPIVCAWHFHSQCQELIKFLKHPSNPLGELADFFY